ncbi:MAG: transglycosylase SLT domain-containing protein [Actinomycetota bacterium]|nr:transglycosylase SLT domain-containing protein [Actinomycetota bacterium]
MRGGVRVRDERGNLRHEPEEEEHMRAPRFIVLSAFATLLLAPAASAEVAHVVGPGETLWSIAAQNNLTTRTVAAYNGLAENAHVVLGSTVRVPTTAEGAAVLARRGIVPAATSTSGAGAPRPQGAYVVRSGDTLTGLAAQAGVPVAQMAYMNGLSTDAQILTGTVMKLPSGAPAPARASAPVPAQRVVPNAAPKPTAGTVSADRVKALATAHGAPGSLAAAIAWQESGFNNAMVSSANARGVMQVMPGTWDWVQQNLAKGPLNPSSAEDNVRAGSLYLSRLLRETNGDPALAAAGYYQGLASVRARGMYDDTKRYVNNVLALRGRFGG